MPHMSPMQWMMMFIGTWSLLSLLSLNSYYFTATKFKKLHNQYNYYMNYWDW